MKDAKGTIKQNKAKWKALNNYKSSKWLALILLNQGQGFSTTKTRFSQHRVLFAPCLCRFPQGYHGEWPSVGRLTERESDEVQQQVTWPAVTQPESGQNGPAGGELAHGAEWRTQGRRKSAQNFWKLGWDGWGTQVRWLPGDNARRELGGKKNAGISLGNRRMLVQHVPLYVLFKAASVHCIATVPCILLVLMSSVFV